jgi:APA family basic amino acid/polyamine antiporter
MRTPAGMEPLRAGGTLCYLREAYAPRPAFPYGWMQLLVIDPGVTASLAIGMAAYTSSVTRISPAEQKILGVAFLSLLGVFVVLIGVPAFQLIQE